MCHFISHKHDREDIISIFECRGDKTSSCHQYPNCDCEIWPCEHPAVQQEECNVLPWMEEVCARECFSPRERVAVKDGPIRVWFEGDCYAWDYEDESDSLEKIQAPVLYDEGGSLPAGLTMVQNNTGQDEDIATPAEWDKLQCFAKEREADQ